APRPRPWRAPARSARLSPMAKSKAPLLALLAIVGVAVGLTVRELLVHQVTVRAADGSTVTIETDPSRLAVEPAGASDTIRRGGIEPHANQPQELPEGTGREANLAGTKVR